MLQSKWLSSGVCLLVVADINLLKIAVFRFTRDIPLVQPFFWCLVSGAWIIKPLYLCLMILISVTLILKELSFYAGVIFDSYQKLHVLVKKHVNCLSLFPTQLLLSRKLRLFMRVFANVYFGVSTWTQQIRPSPFRVSLPLGNGRGGSTRPHVFKENIFFSKAVHF